MVNKFYNLEVWQLAHELVIIVYQLCKKFPPNERFGLISQLQRSAISVTSNIAEGFGRYNYQDKMRFYRISRGSVCELENLLIVAKDVGYVHGSDIKNLLDNCEQIEMMINGLIRSLRDRKKKASRIPNSNFQRPYY